MQASEIQEILATIQALYPKRFEIPEGLMRAVWLQEFQPVALDCARQAVQRWARQHSNGPPPTIELLREVCDWIAEDQRRQQARQRAASRPDVAEFSAALTEAARREHTDWAHRHILLFHAIARRSPGESMDAAGARLCRQYAEECPKDRAAWLAEAAWYDEGAPLNASPLPRSAVPGRTVPSMVQPVSIVGGKSVASYDVLEGQEEEDGDFL